MAVRAANAYNVSLDYLFGTGYRSKEKNESNLYELGFSEESYDFLNSEERRNYLDAILSHPYMNKILDCMHGLYYKPLVNSYEVNYISRLISDMLYQIIVNVTKEAYNLRPMFESEVEELLEAVKNYLRLIESKKSLPISDYDKFVDCEDSIETELERIQILLENAPDYEYDWVVMESRREGYSQAIKDITKGDILPMSIDPKILETWLKVRKDFPDIPAPTPIE